MAGPFDFTGQDIENTYQRVLQTDGTDIYDGTGSLFTIPGNINTGSFVTTSSFNSYTGSNTSQFAGTASFAQTASFAISTSSSVSSSFASTASFALTSSFLNSTTNAFIQNGNSFGTTALLGTNDSQSLALETSGSTRMFISSSGNVGIGTLTPTGSLHIVDAATSFTIPLQLNSYFRFRGDGVMRWGLSMNQGILSWDTGKVIMGASSGNNLELYANGAARVFVSGSGNVGIGTTAPTVALQVGDTTSTGNYIRVLGTGSGTDTTYDVFVGARRYPRITLQDTTVGGAATFQLWNLGSQMRFGTNAGSQETSAWFTKSGNAADVIFNGNVGIGIASPTTKLDVSGSVNISGSGTRVPLQVSSGSTSLLFVSSSGNVGIGTTTPTAKLDVSGFARITNGLTVTGSLTVNGTATITGTATGYFIPANALGGLSTIGADYTISDPGLYRFTSMDTGGSRFINFPNPASKSYGQTIIIINSDTIYAGYYGTTYSPEDPSGIAITTIAASTADTFVNIDSKWIRISRRP